MALPVILLCGPEHADVLESEFSRYVRDYEVRVTRTAAEACDVLREIVAGGAAGCRCWSPNHGCRTPGSTRRSWSGARWCRPQRSSRPTGSGS